VCLILNESYFVVGLGNPGKKYDYTRHNVGFEVIDKLAAELDIIKTHINHKAIIGETKYKNNKVYLIKPQTYMNLSGESVRSVVEWFKVQPQNLILVYDDIDLDVGKLRIRKKGSAGSHNGMKSVIYQLQFDDFPRVRIGIGKNPPEWSLKNYVLSKFSKDEMVKMEEIIEDSKNAILCMMNDDIDTSMNKFNRK
jgi:PTH1 family peptidyl-tRNA hydrolase